MGERFGRLLRKYRIERGISQWELYGELGECGYLAVRGGSIVSKWETGRRRPPYETILALERILQLPGGSLVSAAGYGPPTTRRIPENSLGPIEQRELELAAGKAPLPVQAGRHQERLLELVNIWTKELGTPLWQFTMTNLDGPGVHRGENSLTWETTPDGVRRRLTIAVDTNVENSLLWECLCQHLQTGGYSGLLEKLDEWERLGGQEIERRAELLKMVDDMLKERLASIREAWGESTPFFGATLVAILVDGLTLRYSFVGEPGAPLYASYCGDFQIGSASTRESAHTFQVHHKTLMTALGSHPLTENVRALTKKQADIASAIEKGLGELLVQGYVPGSCGHCPPRLVLLR